MSDYNPDTDPRSSNTLIRAYLTSKGLPLNGENVRRALEANNANRGTIPGLVNSLPSTEAEDQAAMAAARGSSVGSNRAPATPAATTTAPGDTSAPPGASGADDTSGMPLWQQILAGAAAGLGFAGGSKLRGRGGAPEPGVGEPGFPDVRLSLNRPEITSQPSQVGGDPASLRLGGRGSEPTIPGVPQPRLLPGAPDTPGQLSGPDAQFQVGGPEAQPRLNAPPDSRPVADPNAAIAASRPAPPDVIPLPGPAAAAPQITDQVPAIDAPAPRMKTPRTRASRARVPARI